MVTDFNSPVQEFTANRKAVSELLNFDEVLIEIVVHQLRLFEERNQRAWENLLRTTNVIQAEDSFQMPARQSLVKVIGIVENVRTHGSLKPRYEALINQCVVLLVSHFGSAVRALFRHAVSLAVQQRTNEAILKYEIRARAGDLQHLEYPMPEFIAEQVISEVSFQDMKSIARAMKQYFGSELPRDAVVNDVVVAHAARHVIVHSGLMVDSRFVNQIRDAKPRKLLLSVQEGQLIQFASTDVEIAGDSMLTYLQRIRDGLEAAIQ